MGRRKKETNFSYINIVSSTYLRGKDYEQAQLNYSNAIGDPLHNTTSKEVAGIPLSKKATQKFNLADDLTALEDLE